MQLNNQNLLKNEIKEVKLLLEGILAYQDIPAPILDLSIAKVERLRSILVQIKSEGLVPDTSVVEKVVDKAYNEVVVQEERHVESSSEETPLAKIEEPLASEISAVVKDEPLKPIVEEDEVVMPVISDAPAIDLSNEAMPVEGKKVEIAEDVVDKPKITAEIAGISNKKQILGETFSNEKTLMNDRVGDKKDTLGQRIVHAPISDLKSAIPINDRFRFQRDLFQNNVSLFNETLVKLNGLASFTEALCYVQTQFTWDEENATTIDFMALLKRRFVN